MLQQLFYDLVARYNRDMPVQQELWTEIEQAYTGKKRHYHNLRHIEALVHVLQDYQNIIADWDAVLFAAFYHDIVYDVMKKDNEAQSADVAVGRLQRIGVPAAMVELCRQHILATQHHEVSDNADINLFTDADLSILGQERELYKRYTQQVRQEYAIYPDLLYKPGRRKVLRHFLDMAAIFKTPQFCERYELQARDNMEWELTTL